MSLTYTYKRHTRYFHRILSTEEDGSWQIIQEAERASFGPFHASIPPIAYCYHLGFKTPKKTPMLQDGEVTGVFNWKPFSIDSASSSLETDVQSLLPPPFSASYADEEAANRAAQARVDEFLRTSGTVALHLSDWFISGAWGFVAALARSLDGLAALGDYWRECEEHNAKTFAVKLLSQRPPMSEFLDSADFSGDIDSGLEEMQLDNTPKSAQEPIESAVAERIFLAASGLAKLGHPSTSNVTVKVPTRYFICSNLISTPFQTDHHHALLILSPDRCIVFLWNWQVPDHAASSAISLLTPFIGGCFSLDQPQSSTN